MTMRNLFKKPAAAAAETIATDPAGYARLGWWLILAGVGGFSLWAAWAPLDQGVPLSGTVTVAGNRKTVQHLGGGAVADILVKDGERVRTGQVLVRMQDVQLRSQAQISRVQLLSAQAAEARLLAERDGLGEVAFAPALAAAAAQDGGALAMQRQLFSARRRAIDSELRAMDENIAGAGLQMQGLGAARDSKRQQLALLGEQLVGVRELAREGYVARNRLLELERNHAQLDGALAEDVGNLGRAQRQVAELKLRRAQRQQEYQKEVRQQLAEAQKERDILASRLLAQDFELANVEVKAPADGVVVGMAVFTRGAVVGPGFRMMDIVPSDAALVVEGQLPVHMVDKVKPGLPVDLLFSAFNQNRTPHVPGLVSQVSADRLVDDKTGQPYYTIKVAVAPAGAKLVAGLGIRAGMPVEVFVRTGERTLVNYLFKPVLDRARMALSEE